MSALVALFVFAAVSMASLIFMLVRVGRLIAYGREIKTPATIWTEVSLGEIMFEGLIAALWVLGWFIANLALWAAYLWFWG